MNTNEHELVLREQVYAIVGAAMEVMNELGHGMIEKPYENALVVELGLRDMKVSQQLRHVVRYKGVMVGEYVPDLIVLDQIIVDTKVIERIGDHELGQMINYLKVTRLRVGIILNFKHSRLEWKRIVL